MSDTITFRDTEDCLRQITTLARKLWPEATYVSVQGSGSSWFSKSGFNYTRQWFLFVFSDARSTLHDEWADSPAELFASLKKLDAATV